MCDFSNSELELLGSAVRLMIGSCLTAENDAKRDFAWEQVWGDGAKLPDLRELIKLSEDATARYVDLATRLKTL